MAITRQRFSPSAPYRKIYCSSRRCFDVTAIWNCSTMILSHRPLFPTAVPTERRFALENNDWGLIIHLRGELTKNRRKIIEKRENNEN